MKSGFRCSKFLQWSFFLTCVAQGSLTQSWAEPRRQPIDYNKLSGKTVECSLAKEEDRWQSLGVIQFYFDESNPPNVKSIKMKEILSGTVYDLEYEADQAVYTQSPKWIPLTETNGEVFFPRWVVMIPKSQHGFRPWKVFPREFHLEPNLDGGRYIQDLPETPINKERRVEILNCILTSY
jgi:hypothetical protein